MKIFATTALAIAAILPSVSHAADGTITFTGSLSAKTCKISGNGAGKDFTVTLPPVSTATLAKLGDKAGGTPFHITLSDCSDAGKAAVYFEPGLSTNWATGALKNSGTAANVEVALLNKDMSPIKLGQTAQGVLLADTAKGGTTTLEYIAQYTATGITAAGTINTSSMYTISYQ
ncbi:fimbrial protein [Duganella violaceipulchra]|nr:fimbrial protein [Duganella violaceicalia]MCP2010643.1 major type 1 subunit fimbrin (pilin) [Duganella violaceicalia]